jgi:hypothetical protein
MRKKKIASIISAVLNAPLVTLVTFLPLILTFGANNALGLIGITSIFVCILPIIGVFFMLRRGTIKDFYVRERESRFKPFLWSIISYLFGIFAFIKIQAPPAVIALMACYLVNGIILLFITLKWKISIHASGIASPVTALVYLLGNGMSLFFLLILPVAWARLELKAHDKLQVTVGAILSSLLTWLQMGLYINYLFI